MARERQAPKNETTYIVLEGMEGRTTVEILGDTLANGPEQAVRRIAENREGTFVAIPARNWTVVRQTSETPPPVISQEISKWAGLRPEEEDETETVEIEKGDVAEVTSIAPPAPVHPAEAIEDDGA